MNAAATAFTFYFQGLACDEEAWGSILIDNDLNVMPGDLAPPTRFESLEKCLLCGESRGIGLCGRRAFTLTVSAFRFGKNTLNKTGSSGDGFAYAIDFRYVDARRKYHANVIRRR